MAEPEVLPLRARGLTVRLGGHEALSDVDFSLEPGQRVALLGANGAGKSVLLRTLHGLIAPQAGSVEWAGRRERPKAQAMVFQRPMMLRRPALENVEYALAAQGVPRAERPSRAMEALDRVGLVPLARRQARVMSGGEQQRLALARAWALRPRVLFLDEPTSSLDPAAATEIERAIGEIAAQGTAIVLATHALGLARRLATEVAFLEGGRLVERTPVEAFFTAPKSEAALRFLQGELPWIRLSPAA